jgi:hypothetical protein
MKIGSVRVRCGPSLTFLICAVSTPCAWGGFAGVELAHDPPVPANWFSGTPHPPSGASDAITLGTGIPPGQRFDGGLAAAPA